MFENKVFRRKYIPEKLEVLYSSPNIITVVKSRKIRQQGTNQEIY